ncbi:MAG: hypothetical protein HC880_00060 [Bacteroidia bacterium]|nr:hypothetical protein [Bacteroidia bacterium]
MQIVVSEDSQFTTYIHITGTGDEYRQMLQEISKLEKKGFRQVGDLILDLDIQERTVFLEKKK